MYPRSRFPKAFEQACEREASAVSVMYEGHTETNEASF